MSARIKNLMVAAATLIMVAAAQCASAATAVYQDGLLTPFDPNATIYQGTEDNQILDPGTGFDDANVGGRNTFQLGQTAIATRRLLLRFDVTSLAGLFTSIDSATITLKKSTLGRGEPCVLPGCDPNTFDPNSFASLGGTDDAQMYAIADNNADWVEGTAIFFEQTGSSSWNSKQHDPNTPLAWIGDQPGDPFSSGGGGLFGALQDTVVGLSQNDPLNSLYTWDLDPNMVEQWITGVNAGVLIKEAAELDGIGSGTDLQLDFYSSEYGVLVPDAPQHPRLEIEFTPAALPGDFDNDGDVDGFDFLLWQQLEGVIFDQDDLTDWENNYGATFPLTAASSAVPEPSTAIFAVLGLAGILVGANGRRSKL